MEENGTKILDERRNSVIQEIDELGKMKKTDGLSLRSRKP